MFKLFGTAIVFVILAGCSKSPQDVVSDATKALGAENLKSVEYSAIGFAYSLGQSPHPNAPWPKFNVKSYARAINFEAPVGETAFLKPRVPEIGMCISLMAATSPARSSFDSSAARRCGSSVSCALPRAEQAPGVPPPRCSAPELTSWSRTRLMRPGIRAPRKTITSHTCPMSAKRCC